MPLAALVAATPAGAQTVSRPSRELVLSIGKGQLVTLPTRMKDVWVANEAIADVQVKSPTQLYVFGKSGGETTLYASDLHGNVIWSATLRVGSNIDSIGDMLRLAMPEAKVHVATLNNTVLLTGTVAAPEDAAEAERLTKSFVGDKTNVISRLRMATPLQVNLQVRFAEVSRSLTKSLTSNLTTTALSNNFQIGISQGRAAASAINPRTPFGVGNAPAYYGIDPVSGKVALLPGTSVTPAGSGLSTIAGLAKIGSLSILAALDAGEQIGLVTTLAQPNLTALSGETASFLAGGEYPIPISNGLGTTTIQFKKYGVSLAYTPTVVPALTIRRAETTIELGSGQSFMIAGLMSNNANNTIQKTPGAGDLPILGTLFRSTSFQKNQTELVIVVTPYLVNPVDANDIKLPTDGYQSPNDIKRLLGNLISDGKSGTDRPKPTEKVGKVSAGPEVGIADEPGAAVAAPAAPPPVPAPSRRAKRADAAPAPGFSF
jgi:pilus assembly protein CpaC